MVARPRDPHMPSMAFFFLLDMVDPGPSYKCFSVMGYLSPSLEKYLRDLWLRIWSLKSPMRRIESPSFSHISTSSFI